MPFLLQWEPGLSCVTKLIWPGHAVSWLCPRAYLLSQQQPPAEVPALCHSSRPALSLFAPREISEKFLWVSVALGSCLQGGRQPGCGETPPGGARGTPELPALLALVLWMEVTGELFVYCPPQEQGAAEKHPVLPWASPSRGIFPSLSEPCAMAVVTGQGSTASTRWQIIPTG